MTCLNTISQGVANNQRVGESAHMLEVIVRCGVSATARDVVRMVIVHAVSPEGAAPNLHSLFDDSSNGNTLLAPFSRREYKLLYDKNLDLGQDVLIGHFEVQLMVGIDTWYSNVGNTIPSLYNGGIFVLLFCHLGLSSVWSFYSRVEFLDL